MNLRRILCLFGWHKPVDIYKTGYVAFARCKHCNCKLMVDRHWIQGDCKWRKTP